MCYFVCNEPQQISEIETTPFLLLASCSHPSFLLTSYFIRWLFPPDSRFAGRWCIKKWQFIKLILLLLYWSTWIYVLQIWEVLGPVLAWSNTNDILLVRKTKLHMACLWFIILKGGNPLGFVCILTCWCVGVWVCGAKHNILQPTAHISISTLKYCHHIPPHCNWSNKCFSGVSIGLCLIMGKVLKQVNI